MMKMSRLSHMIKRRYRRGLAVVHPLHRDQAGFTLMETMIAVGLLAVISGISLMLMMGYIQGNESLNRSLDRVQTLGQMRAVMADDLLHITRRSSRDQTDLGVGQVQRVIFAGQSMAAGFGQPARQVILQFTRSNSLLGKVDPARSEIETVRYFIKDSQLIRRIYDRPDALRTTPYRDQILLDGVRKIDLKFYHQGLWADEAAIYDAGSFADDNSPAPALPTMVSVTIQITGSQNQAVPRTAGIQTTEHTFELGKGGLNG